MRAQTLPKMIEAKTLEAAFVAATDARDAMDTAKSSLYELEALFMAIEAACGEHSQGAKLASIGAYLAAVAANRIDCDGETLHDHVTVLRATQGVPIDAPGRQP